jgi:hypothetical protein
MADATRKYFRDPTDSEVESEWAHEILADLPASGEGCETVDQRLAAARVHALLAVVYELRGLAQIVQDAHCGDPAVLGIVGAMTGIPA